MRAYTATLEADYTNGDGSMLPVDSAPVTFYVASFSVKTNSWSPNPAYVGEIVSGQVQGNLDPSSLDGGGSGPDFVTYAWITGGVWYSQSGTAGTFEPYGGNAIVAWTQGQASTTFSAQFGAPGQYLLEVVCTATVYSQYNGSVVATFTQSGYIGGSASDIDTSGGTGHAMAVHHMTAHGRTAHAGGGGDGITVLPALVTFTQTSLIKLGLGAPNGNFKQITATVTPASQVNNVIFSASNDEVDVSVTNLNPATGIVTLNVTAVSETPSSTMGASDCNVDAFDAVNFEYTEPVATVPVLVLEPTFCGEQSPPNITEQNEYFMDGDQDLPYWVNPNFQQGSTRWYTTCWTEVTITIFDQFHTQLDQMYDGDHVVDENVSGTNNPASGAIAHPDGTLTNGTILDEVRDTNDEYRLDDPKIDMQWDSHGYTGFNGYDNAISSRLAFGQISSQLFTLTQVLSTAGYKLSPAWTRQYTIYARNHAQGAPMSFVTETAVPGT